MNADVRTAGVTEGRLAMRTAFRTESRTRDFAIIESRRSSRLKAIESRFARATLSCLSFPICSVTLDCAKTMAARRDSMI